MLLLKNGKILENGVLVSKDILIDDKKIVKIDKNIQENVEKVLDLEGNIKKIFTMHLVQQLVVDLLQQCQCQT